MTRRLAFGMISGALLWLGAATMASAALNHDQVGELRSQLDKLADAIAAGDAAGTRQAADTLQRWSWKIHENLPVDLIGKRALNLGREDFDPQAPSAQQLLAAIHLLTGNLDRLANAPPNDPAELAAARAALTSALAESEFQVAVKRDWFQELMMRLMRWIQWLMQLFERVPGAGKIATLVYYLVIAVLLTPLVILIIYVIRWQLKQKRATPSATVITAGPALEEPATHLARAQELQQRGLWLEALKQYYLAGLAALERQGWVTHDRTRTNWEYLAQLEARAAAPEWATLLRGINRLYDRAVFGTEPCTSIMVDEFADLARRLQQGLAPVSPKRDHP